MTTVIRYCPACGARLDEDGICTRDTCARRALQLKAKALKVAAAKARTAEKQPEEATKEGQE